jgi:hypothetical protein
MEPKMSINNYKAEISRCFKKLYGKDCNELSISEELLELSHSAGETPTEFIEWFKSVENQWCASL